MAQRFTPADWRHFCDWVHAWRPAADGLYRCGDLAFTRREVAALVDGIDAGNFRLPIGTVIAA